MRNLNPGDLVTFPLRDATFGVALVVHVDDLSLNDLYHLAICDAVVGGSDAGEDEFGRPLPREHDMAAIESAPMLIEHVALTRHGLDASDVSVVAEREIGDGELEGYRAWLHLRFQDAVRRGVMRERIDDNPEYIDDDEPTDVEDAHEARVDGREDDDTDASVVGGEDGEDEEAEREAGGDLADASEVAVSEPAVTAATLGVQDVALGLAIIRQRSIFERDAYRDSALGRFVLGLGDDVDAIETIIARLIDGDFSAGDELIDYGDAGMRALGARLTNDMPAELADDILQVLVNSGETVAYERIGSFMAEHGTNPDAPLYGSAVRAYCYAVMLTAGEPESLKQHLSLLEEIRDPEFLDDIRSAREALAGEG